MAISPRAGATRAGRQRKWCSRSSSDGALNECTLHALRIDAGHHVLDRAILPGRVERLEDDHDGLLLRGPEHVLRGRQSGDVFQQRRLRFFLVLEAGGEAGIVVLELDLLPRRHQTASGRGDDSWTCVGLLSLYLIALAMQNEFPAGR